ncbi:hypothetical protein E8E14_001282 [Neopestalotiopsis sp. 37M]|nr:hypothetical protein E8E14_001282 [Neopestalotiopsis sp. 37M]
MQRSAEQVEMMPGPVQHHSPLPSASHTRIIELQPAVEASDDLHVEISVVDLSLPMASYEALSYTWGGIPSSSKVIASQTRAFSVTKNLEDALRRFRLAERPRRLWIDALSINQNDDKEKNHQIPLMSAIFQGAAAVLVWLGRDAQVEASLDRLSELGRLALSDKWPIPADDVADMKECISRVINLSWFSRRWIIQEVVFNVDVVLNVGFREISFLKFMTIVRKIGYEGTEPNRQLGSTLSIFELWENFNFRIKQDEGDFHMQLGYNGEDCCLLRLMRVFSHFGCADARDHIFTIAPLAQDISMLTSGKPVEESSQLPLLAISYENSVQDIYTQFAEFVLNSGHIHWVLAQAAARAGKNCDVLSGPNAAM